jgi:hypothetical protein
VSRGEQVYPRPSTASLHKETSGGVGGERHCAQQVIQVDVGSAAKVRIGELLGPETELGADEGRNRRTSRQRFPTRRQHRGTLLAIVAPLKKSKLPIGLFLGRGKERS